MQYKKLSQTKGNHEIKRTKKSCELNCNYVQFTLSLFHEKVTLLTQQDGKISADHCEHYIPTT